MNTKFSVKDYFLIWITIIALSIGLVYPWQSRYLKLDFNSKLRFIIIPWICLIIIAISVSILLKDFRKNKLESLDDNPNIENKDDDLNTDNVKNIIINNYQTFQHWYSRKKYIKIDTIVNKITNVSIDDKIAVIHRLRELDNENFEFFIGHLFELNWYTIDRWPLYSNGQPQPDWWKDLIMTKNNQKYGVQIKKYIDRKVPVGDARDLKWALEENEKWIFVTISIFSKPAKSYCYRKKIIYKDYLSIWDMIRSLSKNDKEFLEKFINDIKKLETNPKYKPMTCKKCWAPMTPWNYQDYYCLNRYEKIECHNKEYIE